MPTWKDLHPFPTDPNKAPELIVSVVNFKDRVIVATQYQLYEVKDGKVVPIEFAETE